MALYDPHSYVYGCVYVYIYGHIYNHTHDHIYNYVKVSGITRRTLKRKPTTLYNPNTPFLFIKLLRKHLNFYLLSCIFIILYFLRT